MSEAVEYFNGNALAANVWSNKYALKDEEGNQIEDTPDQMHSRMAREFSRITSNYTWDRDVEGLSNYGQSRDTLSYSKAYYYFQNFKYIIPQGSIMAGLGNDNYITSLSNCVVIDDVVDSYGGIMYTDQQLAQLMKRRCGVGVDISNLRPRGARTQNAAKTSTGTVSFAKRFSKTTNEVAQEGRRGALMLTLDCRHPEVLEFISSKADNTSITGANISVKWTEDFMEAVRNRESYTLRYPVDASVEEATYTEEVDAHEVFEQASMYAHGYDQEEKENSTEFGGDPGCMFIDNMKSYSTDCGYPDVTVLSTNPCFSGDTRIATADGRDSVTIKKLAEEGKDVDVYAVNRKTGDVEIKRGRNPRITGYNKTLLKISFGNYGDIKVTPNHRFPLKSGEVKKAKNLEEGDSVLSFSKRSEYIDEKKKNQYYRVGTNTYDSSDRVFEHRLIARYNNPEEWEEMYQEAEDSNWKSGGVVVHHKDYDPRNNSPENLELMTWRDHNQYHADHDTQGEKNGRFSGYSKRELESHGITLCEILGRKFGETEWFEYAESRSLPKSFSDFRKCVNYKTVAEFSKYCAEKANVDKFNHIHNRSIDLYFDLIKQGYDCDFNKDGHVIVRKTCECCNSDFWTLGRKREVSYCSNECSKDRLESVRQTYKNQSESKREKQLEVFSDLKYNMNEDPSLKEWKQECENRGISKRLRTKYGFNSYSDLKDHAEQYNHKVTSVEEVDGKHTVYNITVDDHHTVATITNKYSNSAGNPNFNGVFSLQCGEIGMDVDSCRLIALNFMGVVDDPFTDDASINYDRLYKIAYEQQVLLDNLVDLEIEKIDRILEKIKNDPEASKYKRIEYETWQDLRDSAEKYRRTGGGFTALGDLLAAVGVEYGTPEGNEVVDKLMSTKLRGEWDASIDLSIQRGSFPEWDDQYDNTEFFDMLAREFPEIYARNNTYGRRNISLSTVAPTGSVSLLANINGEYGTTSGIEPVFSTTKNKPWHTRRRRITEEEDLEPEGVDDSGFPYVTYNVFHEGFKQYLQEYMHENGSYDSVEDVPDEKLKDLAKLSPYVTSAGLNYRQRIKLQSIVQKYTTHSISSTLNLPENSNWRETLDIYKTAYAEDLKGVTIFRNGSKQGVLGDSDNSSDNAGRGNEITYHDAPERPQSLDADLYYLRDEYLIAVGMLNDKPYEVFVLETDRDQDYGEEFQIYKKGSRTYNLISKDSAQYIEDILQYSPSSDADVLTRFTSQLMRHGVKMDYIVEQVRKADISINDFSNVLAGVLEQYTSEEYTLECEKCGSENVKYVEGCATCMDCGASKCS